MSTDRAHAYPVQTLSGQRRSLDYGRVGVWFFRALLLIPFVSTANRPAQQWLGRHWKAIQRLTYVVWGTVLLHLLLLFGLSTIFLYAVAVSTPLAVMRIPSVRRWWTSARRTGSRRIARVVAALALVAIFSAGFVPLANELAQKGAAAVTQHPARD